MAELNMGTAPAAAPAPTTPKAEPEPKPQKEKPKAEEKKAPKEQTEKQPPEEAPEESAAPSAPAAGGGIKLSGMDLWNPTPMQVFVLGSGLIALNFFTQTDLTAVLGRLWDVPKTPADVAKAATFGPTTLWQLGGELMFVLLLSFVTGLSPTLGRASTLFLLSLYLVWVVFNGQKLALIPLFVPPPATRPTTQLNTTATTSATSTTKAVTKKG